MDKNIGALSPAVDFSDDSLLVVQQQGEAKKLEGLTLKNYIRGVASESIGGGDGAGGSGTMDHSKLINRSAAAQHPASSIAFSKNKTDFVSGTVQGVLEEIAHDLTNAPGGGGGTATNVLRVPGGGDAEIDPAFGGPPYTFTFTPATSGDGGGTEDMASYEWGRGIYAQVEASVSDPGYDQSITFTDVPDADYMVCISSNPIASNSIRPTNSSFVYYALIDMKSSGSKGTAFIIGPDAGFVSHEKSSCDVSLTNGELTLTITIVSTYFSAGYLLFPLAKKTS